MTSVENSVGNNKTNAPEERKRADAARLIEGRCFIDGAWWVTPNRFGVFNPANGRQVGWAADGSQREAEAAVDAAHRAQPAWERLLASERARALTRISAELLRDFDRIAGLIVSEQGKTRSQAEFEVRYAAQWLDWYAEEARRAYGEIIPAPVVGKRLLVLRKALGVAVAITPWNFPLAMIARKLAPALAAGCTIVVKPARLTPLSAVALFEVIERAGLPAGVANLVTTTNSEVRSALLMDRRVAKITFTGSTEVGKLLIQASADHLARLSLELGGQAPFIVFDDCDLDLAVAGVLASKFQINGQSCLCANRIYVHRRVKADFTERLVAAVRRLCVGDGADAGVDIGPLIDERGFEKVQSHVDDAVAKGAEVLCGGGRAHGEGLDKGWFFEPTVLQGCREGMLVAEDETFGPVIPLLDFDADEEVLARANATIYGLVAYMYTKDLGRAFRIAEGLEYGIVGVNDPLPAYPGAPFGGFKESGLGREGGHDGMQEFLETKLVSILT